MKVYFKILLLQVLLSSCLAKSGAEDIRTVESFCQDLISTKDEKKLLHEYFCSTATANLDKMPVFKLLIKEHRKSISTSPDFKIVRYLNLSDKERNLSISKEIERQVFKVVFSNSHSFYIWLRENRIRSISIISKGDRRMLLDICDK